MRKILSLILVATLFCGVLAGCDSVGEIAQNVADAAMEELKAQVAQTLEKNKVEVIETKTDHRFDGDLDFFVAVLVRCDSEDAVKACATALSAVFTQAGYEKQTGNVFTKEGIPSGSITFDHADYAGNYYVVYGYIHMDIAK